MSASRWFVLVLVLTACGSSPRHVGAASAGGDTEPPSGLFGGTGGGAGGDGTVTLMGQDAGAPETDGATEDASTDAGGSDGAMMAEADGGVDAGEDAGPVNPQCQPCVTMCPDGFACFNWAGGSSCLERAAEGACGDHRMWLPLGGGLCGPATSSCAEWLDLYGN